MTGCGCDPLTPAPPYVDNPPGQPALRWQVAQHGASLRRMRAVLAADPRLAVRALTRYGPDEPAVALLDAWAVVADVVSFYTERIAQEGFLRTATELRSVRELARTLGYELRPGVAAAAELAFTVEDTPGSPTEVSVPAGTPVQTVPAQGQLPQTFETSEDLLARPAWNAIRGADAQPQAFTFENPVIWLRGTGLGVQAGDVLVMAGQERLSHEQPIAGAAAREPEGDQRWDFRIVDTVTENPAGLTGWTRLHAPSSRTSTGTVSDEGAAVFTFAERANLFGWNSPDPAQLTSPTGTTGSGTGLTWADFGAATGDDSKIVELDGDHPRLRGGDVPGKGPVEDDSWIVLDGRGQRGLYRAVEVVPDGASRYGMSGRVTRVTVDLAVTIPGTGVDRRSILVHCQSLALPAAEAPRHDSVQPVLDLQVTEPLLSPGRRVLVTGSPSVGAPPVPGAALTAAPSPLCEPATVLACTIDPDDDAIMKVTLDHALTRAIEQNTLRVLANTVGATHGESVHQVLGSGDGRVPFQEFQPARGPLTYVRDATASGARSTMELRVDGVAWTEVASLDGVAGHDRVFTLRHDEDGAARLALGDGVHGARASTGSENVVAAYRVGIGEPGAAAAGQLSLLLRRPPGIRDVLNPRPAHDWAPPETLQDARRNAPLRIRTLDRAVSVADHEDFAAAFAGVGNARADEVWDGRAGIVAVSVLGAGGTPVSSGLLTDLGSALAAARDPGTPLQLLGGERLWFGVRVELRTDPAYQRAAVEQAVRDALAARLAPAVRAFAAPVTAASVLVVVRTVPGVAACTMPRLLPLPGLVPDPAGIAPQLPGDEAAAEVSGALPARWDAGAVQPAQLLGLAPGGVAIGGMPQ